MTDEKVQCPDCRGVGEVFCPVCRGNGKDPEGGTCRACLGRGYVKCNRCLGKGYVFVETLR